MNPSLRPRGFTLVELMVGMALSLVIVGIVTYGFNSSQRVSSRALSLLDIHSQMVPALALLERDVAGAILFDNNVTVARRAISITSTKPGSDAVFNADIAPVELTADPKAASAGQPRWVATPAHRLWFRYNHDAKNNASSYAPSVADPGSVCELVMLTSIPVDRDGDGHPEYRSGTVWVRWVAERIYNGDRSFRLRLTRQLPRFLDINTSPDESYKNERYSIASLRAGEIAGHAPNANGTLNVGKDGSDVTAENFDPDRYFGAPQVLFDVRETFAMYDPSSVDRANATVPTWDLYILSQETRVASGDEGKARVGQIKSGKTDSNILSGASEKPEKWFDFDIANPTADPTVVPMGIQIDLTAYPASRLDQPVNFKRLFSFPAAPRKEEIAIPSGS